MKKLNPVLFLLAAALVPPTGCARDTGDAGVKPIGVGFDPGDLFPGPEERGGVIDLVQVNTRGHNLDFGVTGFFGSSGAFTSIGSDPFDAILGWGWFFSPALLAADEYSALSPKGPDLPESCFVQVNTRGPLGSFRTVDVGDNLVFASEGDEPTSFTMTRNPQDYPVNTSSVFIYYIGLQPLLANDPVLPDNWAYGTDLEMQFTGALPPENAPVAAIPLPSDAEDERVGKAAGHPTVFAPHELTGITVSNQLDPDDGQAVVRFAPTSDGLPNFLGNDGVLHVQWDIDDDKDYSDSKVTVGILLLREGEGSMIEGLFGDDEFCIPAEPYDVGGERDEAWAAEYNYRKEFWCDPGYEPDLEIGNDEFGLDLLGDDTCHNGLDDNDDGRCDEGGCEVDGEWLAPDPNCARHALETSVCGSDGLCRSAGGDRGGDGHVAELLCTADDDGEFVVPADQIEALMDSIDATEVVGAVLKVARTSEVLIEVPTVRDIVGNEDNINPVRLRASQVVHGRFDWGE